MKSKNFNVTAGFTLIETMVVVVLVAMILVGVSGLLVSNLRGGGKATILADLRDEGDAAMFRMERELRYGTLIDASYCTTNAKEIEFQNQEGDQVKYEFSNGLIRRYYDHNGSNYAKNQQLFGDEVVVPKEGGSWNNVRPFDCLLPTNDFEPVVVKITFALSAVDDAQIRQIFDTSVTLRN